MVENSNKKPHLLIFGFGYTAAALSKELLKSGWRISATSRYDVRRREMERLGIEVFNFPDDRLAEVILKADFVLNSVPPTKAGDPVYMHYQKELEQFKGNWLGYLSTTGVYGDYQGKWVDEESAVQPTNSRLERRIHAENCWLHLHKQAEMPSHIFRLSGIYGPGRGVVSKLRNGTAQRIYKEGQYFSRIHVEDIARALTASMLHPEPGEIYNVSDNLPAPSHEVLEYAAQQLGMDVPPLIDWQQAEMSEMAQEFYRSNRRVKGEKMRALLPEQTWKYPSYKEGIAHDVAIISSALKERNYA